MISDFSVIHKQWHKVMRYYFRF